MRGDCIIDLIWLTSGVQNLWGSGQRMAQLRIGVLLDSDEVEGWQHQILEFLAAADFIAEVAAIRFKSESPSRHRRRDFASIAFRILQRFERLKLARIPPFSDAMARCSVAPFVARALWIKPIWSRTGVSWSLSEADLETVLNQDFDVLLNMSSGVIRGEVLHSCRHGILSLHCGDNRRYRGLPPGFWEVFEKRRISEYVVQVLGEELDGGAIVARGTVTTQTYFIRNQYHLFMQSAMRLCAVLRHLGTEGSLPSPEASLPYSFALRTNPRLWQVLSYAIGQSRRLFGRLKQRILGYKGRWSVALCDSPWQRAVLWRAREIQPAHGTWIADPFIVDFAGRTLCFVEEFVLESQRGRIAVFQVDENVSTRLGVAIEEDYHMSFPYIFENNGVLYMSPETLESEQIRLYRCLGDPLSWTLHAILVDNVRAVDPVVINTGESWLLLANVDETGANDFGCGVWAYESQSLGTSNWSPLKSNPIWSSGDALRNAGLIRSKSDVYRVGQFADLGSYGTGFTVERLSISSDGVPGRTDVTTIVPEFWRDISGTHHLSSTDSMTAFDVYRG